MERTMNRVLLGLVAVLLAACSGPEPVKTPPPVPDAPEEVAKTATRADRRQFISESLVLTEEQAQVFWPLYEEYQSALDPLYDRLITMNQIYEREYGQFTDERARWLVDEYLSIETARLKLRQDFLPRFRGVLPEKKVTAYYQLENKLYALFMYEAAMKVVPIE